MILGSLGLVWPWIRLFSQSCFWLSNLLGLTQNFFALKAVGCCYGELVTGCSTSRTNRTLINITTPKRTKSRGMALFILLGVSVYFRNRKYEISENTAVIIQILTIIPVIKSNMKKPNNKRLMKVASCYFLLAFWISVIHFLSPRITIHERSAGVYRTKPMCGLAYLW